MTWRTPVIAIITALSVVLIRQVSASSNRVLGDTTGLLSPLVSQTPSLTSAQTPPVTASPTTIPTQIVSPPASPSSTPTAVITQKPTPTVKPQPTFTSEQIYGFTNQYGILYAVDSNVIRHVAVCESGFNPAAKHLMYAGLFQFDTQTWQTYRVKMGLDADPDLRYHAEEAVKTATYIFSLGKTSLWPNCYPK